MDYEITSLMRQLSRERDLPLDDVVAALEEALLSGYRRMPGADPEASVLIDLDAQRALLLAGADRIEFTSDELVSAFAGDDVGELELASFGRGSVMAVRRAMRALLRRAEEQRMAARLADQIGDAMLGTVRMVTRGRVLVDLGHGVEGVIPASEQVARERLRAGERVWTALVSVDQNPGGLEIVLSRRSPDLVRGLLEVEIPEVAEGRVEIVGVVRRAGYRTKVGVRSEERGQDPVGAIIGPRGARVRGLMRELGGERIDVVNLDHAPDKQLARALQPASAREVHLDRSAGEALVVVPDDELARAIGPEGANARLAAGLTGWRISLRSVSAHAAAGHGEDGPEGLGCSALRANGRRCPNAPLPGSPFCGLHAEAAAV